MRAPRFTLVRLGSALAAAGLLAVTYGAWREQTGDVQTGAEHERSVVANPQARGLEHILAACALAAGLLAILHALAARSRDAELAATRLAADETRRALGERYEHIFRHSADAVLLFDEDLRVVDANDQALELYGYSLDELCALTMRDLRAPDAAGHAERDAEQIRAEGRRVFQTEGRRKDGSLMTVEASSLALEIDGRTYIEGIVRNVTEQRRKEQSLLNVNRANRFLGGVGRVLATARDPQALFDATCRVAAQSGEFSLAAITAASEALPDAPNAPNAPDAPDAPDAAVPSARSELRESDAPADVHSCATFPLKQGGRTVATLRLGTAEPGFFGPGELMALSRVADGLSLTLDALEVNARREAAEKSLAQSEEALRGFFGDSAALMCLVELAADKTYRFLLLNPPLARLFALEPGSSAGKPLAELGLSERTAHELRRHALALAPGQADTWEQEVELGGSLRAVAITAAAIRTDGPTRRIGLLAVDITPLRAAERELEANRALLASVVDAARDAIVVVNCDGVVVRANAAVAPLFGRPPAELLGQSLDELVGEELSSIAAAAACEPTEPSLLSVVELTWTRPDGGLAVAEASFSPIETAGTRHCAIIFRDVGERRRDEVQRRILAQVVEQSSSLVLVTDTAGRIEYVNPRFTEVTGYVLADVVGKTPRVLKSGRTPAATYAELWHAIGAGKRWQGELTNRRSDAREFVTDVTISPLLDDAGVVTHFVGSQEDVTERRRLETELRQAQKLESLGLLAGGVAHDFNNLLTAIIGFAGFLAEELPIGSATRADALEIQRTGERAAGLTRQLLAFSRRQAISPVALDIGELAANLYKMLRRVISENIELSVVPSPATPFVQADPGQLEQVVMNLAVNARDAMPNGGVLRIETDLAEDSGSEGPMGPVRSRHAVLRVTDTGTGMTEATMARIFEPFFTTKDRGHGTGLGLATCFGIVKQAGGTLRVRSKLGEGSVFEVLLPALEVRTAPRAESIAPASLPAATGTILLVEDEPSVRSMAKRALVAAGYEVMAAGNGEEALSLMQHHPEAFALLVSDVVMPRMGGVELAAAARKLCPELRVLMISGYIDGDAIEGLARAGETFLAKPFTARALVRQVHKLLTGE